jgi:general secretion pathway protein I
VNRRGFSLLEVILALAILGGAIAALGTAMQSALQGAQYTRDLTRAQMLCETQLAQLIAGISLDGTTPGATTGLAADQTGLSTDPADSEWTCSADTISLTGAQQGLALVKVTAARPGSAGRRPVSFSLVRWIPDPNAATTQTNNQSGQSGTSSSGSTTGGSP